MTDPIDPLVEAVVTAWRPRDPDGAVRAHPSYYDLHDAGRRLAFEEARRQRALEAGLDAEGLSTTARAVMARIRPTPG
jgi:hypothetical protein